MSDKNLLEKFAIVVPEPGEILRSQIIHPDNIAIEQDSEQYKALILPNQVLKRLQNELKLVTRQLSDRGYSAIVALFDQIITEYHALISRRKEIKEIVTEGGLTTADKRNLWHEWQQSAKRIEELKTQASRLNISKRELAPLERKRLAISRKLEQHQAAIAREDGYRRGRGRLEEEAKDLHDIIINCLTGLGYCYRYTVKNVEYTNKVKIAEIHSSVDAHYFKILTTEKTFWGWAWALPRNINPHDLIEERTLNAVSTACERQVEGFYNNQTGVWFRVNRLGVQDGIVEKVSYEQVMAFYPGGGDPKRIPIPVGIKQGLVIHWAELASYPHFLIAGSSGSGKSNLVKLIISTIISRQNPKDVRLVFVDMKEGQEFLIYEDNKIPHMLGKMVRTPPELLTLLAQLEKMRIERTQSMSKYYAVDLDDYNARAPEAEKLARIVVVIDEFSAIYMSDPFQDQKENNRIAQQIKNLVRQLLAKARSAGIHLIICTQSPYAEILPGIDKANISIKIVGRFIDKVVSRTILGNASASEIPENIKGRMIIQTAGYMWVIQTPYVSNEDRINSIKQSLLFESPEEQLQLPETTAPQLKKVTREEIIELSLNEYGGSLGVRKIWNGTIKHTGRMTHAELDNLIKSIISDRQIEHQGIVYKVERITSGYALKAITANTEQHDETIEDTVQEEIV